jgi:hypothetical protein
MARSNSQNISGGVGKTPPPLLTSDQQASIAALKAERSIYESKLQKAISKRAKIKEILDNFEAVVVGDIILDILPDESSEEIMNSIIISKIDILNHLNGIDVEEIETETTTSMGFSSTTTTTTTSTASGFTAGQIENAQSLLEKIFNTALVKNLIFQSSELDEGELYTPIYYQVMSQINSNAAGKEVLTFTLNSIENGAI